MRYQELDIQDLQQQLLARDADFEDLQQQWNLQNFKFCLLIDMVSNSCGLATAVLRQAEQAELSSKPWAKLTAVLRCTLLCCRHAVP